MYGIQQRIDKYFRDNGRAPSSLDQLPVIPNKVTSSVDGWGRQIGLSVDGDVITLTSLGADGKPGGTGDNKDFVCSIRVADGKAEWITAPRLD
jgi:hypothetical protein